MSHFNRCILFCFGLLLTLFSGTSKAQEVSIKGQFELSGQIDYQFEISNSHSKLIEKFWNLESTLHIELTSAGDTLKKSSEGQWIFLDNGDGRIAGHVYGKIPQGIDSELVSDQMLILSSEIKWFPFSLIGYSYRIEVQDFKSPFLYIPSEHRIDCGPKCRLYTESRPQQELYIVLGNYRAYAKQVNGITLGVALHQADQALADGYLQMLPDIVNRYSQMIGHYHFQEFWVIENQNETGYGMPGFTLLGKSVIRLPFLLKSSLPHEVLHNWLGNSIYVDYEKGNWCEGLTTHLADHFEQKLMKQDSSYRRNALLNYTNFTTENADFPLIEFKGRHSGSTQAVGYDKSMMVFQMIQDYLGEKIFYQRLQKIYKDFYFQQVGFQDFVKAMFENQSQAYEPWLPWVNEKGQAQISAKIECEKNRAILKINSQPKQFVYRLEYLKKKSTSESVMSYLNMIKGSAEIELPSTFDAVVLDPDFKVFRQLSSGEKPLALSEVFGKKMIYAVVDDNLKEDFALWKEGVQSTFPVDIQIISAEQMTSKVLPSDLVLFYSQSIPSTLKESKYLDQISIQFFQGQLAISNQSFTSSENAWVVMGKGAQQNTVLWVKPQQGVDAKSWGRQLTHYTQMGVLVFKDRKNIFKNSYAAGKSDLELSIPNCQQ